MMRGGMDGSGMGGYVTLIPMPGSGLSGRHTLKESMDSGRWSSLVRHGACCFLLCRGMPRVFPMGRRRRGSPRRADKAQTEQDDASSNHTDCQT